MTWLIIVALVAAVLWLIVRRNEAIDSIERIEARLGRVELQLQSQRERTPAPTKVPAPPPAPARTEPVVEPPVAEPARLASRATPPSIPPVLPPQPEFARRAEPPRPSVTSIPPVLPPEVPKPRAEEPALSLERFLGVKLFAWVGGLLLFLAAAFFIKHAFDKNLITPAMRVTFGYVAGLGLVVGGLCIPRERHAVTVQTLCATGLVVLYANIFASHALFEFIGPTFAFALMAVVTGAAFYLAIRLNAQVVAVLGLLGGFLTPRLLATGTDNAAGLFGYLALLDLGLLAVAVRQRWNYLTVLAAAATAAMQFTWVNEFYVPGKNTIAMTVFLGFGALFVGAFVTAHFYERVEQFISAAVIVVLASALIFPLYVLWHPWPEIASNAVLLFGFVFLVDAGFLALAWLRPQMRMTHLAAGSAVFFLLSSWTVQYLTAGTLNTALTLYLVFAIVHSVFPIVLDRVRPGSGSMSWSHVFPSLALVLVLLPIAKDTELSWMLWPAVLVIDLLAIGLAIFTLSLTSILAVFLLTALLATGWIMQMPRSLPDLPQMLVVITGFAVFFMAASLLAARKVFATPDATDKTDRARATFAQVASLGATLPFLLLTLVTLRLPLADPTPLFGVAALLLVLMLALVRFFKADWFAPVGLASVLFLEHAWHLIRHTPAYSQVALGWYLGFALLVLAFPFVSRLEKRVVPWATAALALPLHFFLIYRAVLLAYPNLAYKGLIPAVLAIPCLAALTRLVLTVPKDLPARNTLLALFGGVSLFFITLVFPIQFERHWITIGWALEGLALVWLFRRVPHPGLRLVGVGLLVTAFVRLALNPWVITEYERTGIPIWNWYLYTYGLVAACLLIAARLLHPPRHMTLESNTPPVLYALGTVLAFLLVNIEIADYFSGPGSKLTFNFSASFAQDMTYSLAWGLFAFGLLAIGFKINNVMTRYCGMALLVFTLLKVFLHDLWRLGGLHRIGSLIGLAVVLIVVSFIYQRFLSRETTTNNAGSADQPAA